MGNDTNSSNGQSITLDDLATMVKRGFNDMDEKFKKLEGKVATQSHVDSGFDGLERSIDKNIAAPSFARDRKLDEKTNTVARKLDDKSVFTRDDVRDVEQISPVAVSPSARLPIINRRNEKHRPVRAAFRVWERNRFFAIVRN